MKKKYKISFFGNLPTANYKYQLIIVDDCSEDNSINVIKENNNFENLKIIKNRKNQGQSFCIYEGIKSADYDIVVTLDADKNNPFDIPNLLKIYQIIKIII